MQIAFFRGYYRVPTKYRFERDFIICILLVFQAFNFCLSTNIRKNLINYNRYIYAKKFENPIALERFFTLMA